MKKLFLTIGLAIGMASLYSQSPQAFNYQAVARDANGNVLAEKKISVRFTIHDISADGNVVYQETHSVTTNGFGLFNLSTGYGSPSIGTFPGISWGSGAKYLEVELDPDGGNSYTSMGSSQLLSVPYALYAGKTTDNDEEENENERVLGEWSLTGNSGIDPATNFLGTISQTPVRFRVGNQRAGEIGCNGYGFNTSLGMYSGGSVNSHYCTFMGYASGTSNQATGFSNSFFGYQSGYSNTLGDNNCFFGVSAGYSNTTGTSNVFFGPSAGSDNTTASGNTFIGGASGTYNTTGSNNTFLGRYTGYNNQTGINNLFAGNEAGYDNLGSNNVFLGFRAGQNNTTAGKNCFIGEHAGHSNTTADSNVFVGAYAGGNNATGESNVFVGVGSGVFNTSGSRNTFLGTISGKSNFLGTQNTFLGYFAGGSNSMGNTNTFIGDGAGKGNVDGDDNTYIGVNAGAGSTSSQNVFIGRDAGLSNTSGINNTAIGFAANTSTVYYNNTTALGAQTPGFTAHNQVNIGSTSVTSIKGQVNTSTYSDGRIKDNVQENVPGLDFITKLRPVTYNLNIHKQNEIVYKGKKDSIDWEGKYDIEKMLMTGFIAQEVYDAAKTIGYDFSGVDKPSNEDDLYSLRYAEFVVPMVKAIQEQQDMIDKQQVLITQQQEMLVKMNELLQQQALQMEALKEQVEGSGVVKIK